MATTEALKRDAQQGIARHADGIMAFSDEVMRDPEPGFAEHRMGDLGHVMPVSHPYSAGAAGRHHSVDYRVDDHYRAAVEPARYLAGAVIDLLSGGAALAREILAASAPALSVPEYLALRRGMSRTAAYDEESR